MKEIHAYQNEDGSFKVEIIETVCVTKLLGKHEVKDTTEKKVEITKASIHISPFIANATEALLFQMEGWNDNENAMP